MSTGRRMMLGSLGAIATAAGLLPAKGNGPAAAAAPQPAGEMLFGPHQPGIGSPGQSHSYFGAFDLAASTKRGDLVGLFQTWTKAAQTLMRGEPTAGDSQEVLDYAPARLSITFGFGAELFTPGRFGLEAKRPAALIELPKFPGDELDPARTGGDLSVQACADDPQVAFHAVRQLARLANGVATLRWTQIGYVSKPKPSATPRNLMGFKDGTRNVDIADPAQMNKFVWVGEEGPDWMQGGSYLVIRRIRMALEHWDATKVSFQEQTMGRTKQTGAPIGGHGEFDTPDFKATDADGNYKLAESSHVRLAAPEMNDGMKILRRPYSYNDGANVVAERWPPWREGLEYDAGLVFIVYQRDPSTGFVPIFKRMSRMDMLNQYTTHTGGGLFAIPGGIRRGEYLGQRLLEG